jgi:hypothetical protein
VIAPGQSRQWPSGKSQEQNHRDLHPPRSSPPVFSAQQCHVIPFPSLWQPLHRLPLGIPARAHQSGNNASALPIEHRRQSRLGKPPSSSGRNSADGHPILYSFPCEVRVRGRQLRRASSWKRGKQLHCPRDTPKAIQVTEGRRRSSICRFGTGLRRRTTRSAVHPSTAGLLDPVLNDDPLAVDTHRVLAARRLVNPRRPAMGTCLRYHRRSSI